VVPRLGRELLQVGVLDNLWRDMRPGDDVAHRLGRVVANLVGAVRAGREVDCVALLELLRPGERAERRPSPEHDQQLLGAVVEVEDHEVARAELVDGRTEPRPVLAVAALDDALPQPAPAGPVLRLLAALVAPDVHVLAYAVESRT